MNYLDEGETLRSRIDTLLGQARTARTDASALRYTTEAAVLVDLLTADATEALVSATLNTNLLPLATAESFSPGWMSYLFTEDTVRAALAGGGYGDPDVLIERLRREAEREMDENPESTETVKVYPVDVDPRISDTADLPPVAPGEATPRLPAEQFPTTDEEPETDFDIDLGNLPRETPAEVLDELIEAVKVSDDDEDEVDLDEDFLPVAERPAPKEAKTAFSELKKSTGKGGKKKGKTA